MDFVWHQTTKLIIFELLLLKKRNHILEGLHIFFQGVQLFCLSLDFHAVFRQAPLIILREPVKLFLMEDGGGSTQMYSNISRLGISPEGGRKVPTVTCVKRRFLPKISRTLQVGCKGEDVRLLQMILGGIECDGSFGNITKKRLKEVQKALKAAGLYAGAIDGSCGPMTLKALGLG